MKVTVYEIHALYTTLGDRLYMECDDYIVEFKPGNVYYENSLVKYLILESKVMEIDNVIVVKMEIDICGCEKLEFIKNISTNLSNAFITISPTEDQDIIIDHTLEPDMYFKITEFL